MNPNPFKSLLHSRKFWIAIFDIVFSLVLYFVGKYAGPGVFEDVKIVIAALNGILGILIGAIAYEDAHKEVVYLDKSDLEDEEDDGIPF